MILGDDDEKGRPTPVPKVAPVTRREKSRSKEAQQGRRLKQAEAAVLPAN